METIYLCGPTVYNQAHIGNIRPILTFDIFCKAQAYLGKKVCFIHNITDIDDKIITRAQQEQCSEQEIAQTYTNHYLHLLKMLNIDRPSIMPTITDNIDVIIDFINQLIAQDVAYVRNNNVFFNISKSATYGTISHQQISSLNFTKQDDKENSGDFALWKNTSIGQKFSSPWGMGRPGWHTECAALINHLNHGKQLTIHGGGIDLVFPHHENENAQFAALHNQAITKQWIHVGHLNINQQKMSKSLQNIIDVEAFMQTHGYDTLRMMFLMTSPTSPINLTKSLITNAQEIVDKFAKTYRQAQLLNISPDDDGNEVASNLTINQTIKQICHEISAWHFASSLKTLHHYINLFQQSWQNENERQQTISYGILIMKVLKIIGFNFTLKTIDDEDKQLYEQWKHLREQKLFNDADKIRQLLQAKKLI